MYKLLYIFPFLLAAAGVSAQSMPERSLVRKGNRQYNKGNYEQAISRYEQALQAVAGQFEATYDLGNALYKAERFDRAEQTMQQAAADSLRTDDERAEAFYNLGNCLLYTSPATARSNWSKTAPWIRSNATDAT